MRVPDIPRGRMTAEQLEEARRRDRQKVKLRKLGKPLRVYEWEFLQAQAKVNTFHSQGMTYEQMGEITGLNRQCLSKIARGKNRSMERDTYDAIMSERFEYRPPESGARTGARISPVGTWRRVEALRAAGFPLEFLSDYMGVQSHNLPTRDSKGVHLDTATRVGEMYTKLKDTDPLDYGITVRAQTWALRRSIRMNLAPPHCWDDDTIDDPEAIAEWTGACGTDEGYRIHVRESIPMCEPCRSLVELDGPSQRFSGTKLRILMDQAGLSVQEVATRTGASIDSVRRWSWSQRRPQIKWIEALASALDCRFNDLLEGEDDAVQDHDFNRIKFAMALEDAGITYKGIATRIGLSHMAVYYWLTGKNTPKIPKIVRAAEELGVDWKEFYQ